MEDFNKNQSLTHGLRTQAGGPNPTPKWVRFVMAVGVAAIVVFAALFVWSQHQVSQLRKDLGSQNTTARNLEENKALVEKVGDLIILPKDETPTIATVNDLEKLKSQPFFANAELGDKVLIYAKAKKAILYRPSRNLIVELAPLSDFGNDLPATNAPQ